jgi:hypothetical protein
MEQFISELFALVTGDPAFVEAGTQLMGYIIGAAVAWISAIVLLPFFPPAVAIPLQRLLTAFIPHLLTAIVRALKNRKEARRIGEPTTLAAEVKVAMKDAIKPTVPLKEIGKKPSMKLAAPSNKEMDSMFGGSSGKR